MLKIIALAILTTVAVSGSAVSAQETESSVEITGLKVEGLVVGTRYKVGADFAAQHDIAVPAPFEFIAPTSKTHLVGTQPAPGGTGIFKVFFVTLDKQMKSNLQFVPMTVEMGPIDERLKSLQGLLKNAFVASVPDPNRAEINVTRATQVGPYAAIEMIGKYDGGADGIVALRIVAIPNPDGVHGILAIINGVPKNTGIQSVGEIVNLDASRALGTFRFE
ncbi:MAG: hypothetical protein ACI861_001756 [Paracoccaceae bacterium]|jgi:hypothetical protein